MCGIAGVKRMGEEKIRESQLRILMCSLQHRGAQASGICLVNEGGKHTSILKEDVPAWEFVKGKGWAKFIEQYLKDDTLMALLHVRAATKGDPKDNQNNHPVFSGKVAVTHNGVINNDDYLFGDLKLQRKAAVDTDIIRAILDEFGLTKKGLDKLSRMTGSAAIAAVSHEYPGKLILGRSGNPLILASTPGQLIWASEKASINQAARPYFERFGITFHHNRVEGGMGFISLNDHSAWMIGDKGLEWHTPLHVSVNFQSKEYKAFENYRSTRNRFYKDTDAEDVDIVICQSCGRAIAIPEVLKDKKLADLECEHCHESLAGAEVIA